MFEDDEANLPKPEECLRRCEMFASITNTDNALAMMFLQNRDWDLQLALSAYYENAELAEGNESGQDQFSSTMNSVIDLTSDNEEVMVVSSEDEVTEEKFETTDHQHAHLFRLFSWNIDGLSKESLSFRTPEVINLILKEKFHVVCLQEVVPETLRSIKEKLNDLYKICHPSLKGDYFPIICVLKHPGLSTVPNSFQVTEFESMMGRQLLSLDVDLDIPKLLPTNPCASRWNGHRAIRVRIFTSHLESCLDFANVRKGQLSLTWNAMQSALQATSSNSASSPICALFCGDLNIRDKEIKDLGGLPAGMVDVWEVCGARPEARFTWDRSRNCNLSLDNHEQVDTRRFRGQRFDRMMLLCRGGGSLRPIDFELRGLERVPNRLHFPSDHWAILGHFDLEPPSSLPSSAAN
nr:traf and tnf receptor associated protein [Hymenolepis microstoma]